MSMKFRVFFVSFYLLSVGVLTCFGMVKRAYTLNTTQLIQTLQNTNEYSSQDINAVFTRWLGDVNFSEESDNEYDRGIGSLINKINLPLTDVTHLLNSLSYDEIYTQSFRDRSVLRRDIIKNLLTKLNSRDILFAKNTHDILIIINPENHEISLNSLHSSLDTNTQDNPIIYSQPNYCKEQICFGVIIFAILIQVIIVSCPVAL